MQKIDVPGHGIVEFPDGMSDEQIVAAIQRNSPPPVSTDVPTGMRGGLEAAASLASGAVAAPVSGFAGLLGSLLPGPQGQGASFVQKVQEGLTYAPRTDMGRQSLEAAAYLPEQFAKGADWVGGKITDVTGSPAAGTAANIAINAVPLLLGKRALTAKPATAKTPATEAFDAGYKLTPTQADRGIVPRALEGLSGTAKMEKLASIKNAENTNRLIKQDLGLPAKENISIQALEAIRSKEGAAYEAVKSSVKTIKPDKKFAQDLQKLRGDFSDAARAYPDIVKNAGVEGLIDSLNVPASPRAMVELTRKLRKDASANLKSFDDPGKQELGFAQRNAATAIENMIDRALTSVGKKDLVSNWRSARQKIAQTHDVEAALNETTGNVSAQYLAKLYKRGKPFTGGMEKAAKFARQFERSARDVDKMKDVTQFGYGDLLNAHLMGGAVVGTGGMALPALIARPALRQMLLQSQTPKSLLPPLGATGLLPLLGQQDLVTNTR